MRTSCDSAGGSSVPEGQGRLQFLTLLVVSKLRFCSIQTIFRVFSCIPTPRHDCLGGQMNTDMNGPEISWRFISSRGKTASTFVWISGQATSPLKDFFTSILSEEDCFRIRVREISRKRSGFAYLVTAGVLPLPDFLSPHFFFSVSEFLLFNGPSLGGGRHGGQGAVPDLGCRPKLTEALKNPRSGRYDDLEISLAS